MRLLILTQKIDKDDDILGFFHGWAEKLAQHCESIIVICLQKGECSLPNNVKVLSLGKENANFAKSMRITRKFFYIFNFYKDIWSERKNYDIVFAHMNQEYILLGGLLWKLFGKRIFLWRNHKKGNIFTRIAAALSDKVFYTSPSSFTARFKKSQIMPAGIDTDLFSAKGGSASGGKIKNSILSLGRISPVKRIEVLIEALKILDNFTASIYGDPTKKDIDYYNKIKKMASNLEKKGKIIFYKGVSNYETPAIYNQHDIFVNLTPTGSFDKTILEAMACGCLPIVCNESLKEVLGGNFLFKEGDAGDLAEKIKRVLNLSDFEKENYREKFRNYIKEKHGLDKLVKKLTEAIK